MGAPNNSAFPRRVLVIIGPRKVEFSYYLFGVIRDKYTFNT